MATSPAFPAELFRSVTLPHLPAVGGDLSLRLESGLEHATPPMRQSQVGVGKGLALWRLSFPDALGNSATTAR